MDDVLGYEGKRVVVTGAASGMGEATAGVLVDLGAEVIALDIKPTSVGVASSIEVDLRDKASIDAAVAAVGSPVDAVFACAGLPGPPWDDVDVMLVNFVGTRHLIDSLVPSMPDGAAIAWVASNACIGWQGQLETLVPLITTPDFESGKAWLEANREVFSVSSYMFSKQAINAFVARQAGQYWKKGVRLNCSNPGPTTTPMMPFFEDSAGKELIDAALGPIHRRSEPIEQAWPLVFLNSPRLTYVTGEAFMVDGGFFGALTTGQIDFSQLTG